MGAEIWSCVLSELDLATVIVLLERWLMPVSQSFIIAFFTVCTDAAESILTGSYGADTRQLHPALGILCF